ncbi:hypothetical protein D9M68_890340 [compost metagenome]
MQEARDDVLEADQPVVDGGFFLHQRAAEQALERAHEPAFDAGQVQRDGVATEVRAAVLGIEEEGSRQGGGAALDGKQARGLAGGGKGNRGIRSAEIDADGRGA